MLAHLAPSSALSITLLIISLFLVLAFEATNGFHDAANAMATVIYTNSLKSAQARAFPDGDRSAVIESAALPSGLSVREMRD
jgi:hypothetical protein